MLVGDQVYYQGDCRASDSCSPDHGSEYASMIHATPLNTHTGTHSSTHMKPVTHITPTLTATHHTGMYWETHLG